MILRNSSIRGIRKLIALFTLSRCFDVLTTNTCLKNRNTKHLETLKIMEILNLVETTSLFHLCRNNSVSSSPEETFAIVQQVQKASRGRMYENKQRSVSTARLLGLHYFMDLKHQCQTTYHWERLIVECLRSIRGFHFPSLLDIRQCSNCSKY